MLTNIPPPPPAKPLGPVKFPELKLQGITYSTNPSILINGKTFFRGDLFTTNAGGIVHFKLMWADVVPADSFITATATDSLGNTSEVSQAFSYLDTDGDGIYDIWESPGWGIDVNSDGIIDQDLYTKGANKNHQDIFVEVDAMVGLQPLPGVLDSVYNAFARVPNAYVSNPWGDDGIKLHIDPLDADTLIRVADFPQQLSLRHGFICGAGDPDGKHVNVDQSLLGTGVARWEWRKLAGLEPVGRNYYGTGRRECWDGAQLDWSWTTGAGDDWQPVETGANGRTESLVAVLPLNEPGLTPAIVTRRLARPWTGGRVRHLDDAVGPDAKPCRADAHRAVEPTAGNGCGMARIQW